MMSIDIRHPDSEEFIMKKQDLTKVTGANVSVQVTDDFMRAAELDTDYILRWPVDSSPHLVEVGDHGVLFDVENYDTLEYGKLYRCRYLANEFMSRYEEGWGYVKKIKAKELPVVFYNRKPSEEALASYDDQKGHLKALQILHE